MKLALVTTYPPGRGSLNEYAFHFVRELAAKREVDDLVLLVDELPEGVAYPADGPARMVPSWRFGAFGNAVRIAAAVRCERPDAVLFNIQFASFGSGRASAALGLLAVPLVRAMDVPTVVILHNLLDVVDLRGAGFRMGRLMERVVRTFGRLVTRAILRADLVAVTIPTYVDLLVERYGARNALLAPHGSFEAVGPTIGTAAAAEEPAEAPGWHPERVLAFGKFGTYKRVEILLEAQRILRDAGRHTEIVIAGQDSPNATGYLDRMREQYADVPAITFTGYVDEADVPAVFQSCGMVAFPYTSTTGSSGVLHQAGEHGRAVVLPDLGDLAEVVREEGYDAEIFRPTDPADLARAIGRLIDDPERTTRMGARNRAAARGLPIGEVVDWYLIHLTGLREPRVRPMETPQWT